MTKWDLSQGCKDFSINAKQSVWYTTWKNWRIKSIWSSQKMQKKLLTKFNTHLWFKKNSHQKVGTEGTYITLHNKPKANIVLNSGKVKAFPPRSETRQGCPLLPLLFNTLLSHSNHRRKRNKRNPNWKGSKTITVCRWHDTILTKS